MTILLLSGYKRSGKDTIAEYLTEKHGYTQYSLAGPLKDMVSQKYGIPRSHLDDQTKKEVELSKFPGWTPRDILIMEGAMARKVDPHFWSRQLVRSILEQDYLRIVVSDVRFPEEIEYIRHHLWGWGVRDVRVIRETDSPTTDPSERSLDDHQFDDYIRNTGTLEELYGKVDHLLSYGWAGRQQPATNYVTVILADGSRVRVTGPLLDAAEKAAQDILDRK